MAVDSNTIIFSVGIVVTKWREGGGSAREVVCVRLVVSSDCQFLIFCPVREEEIMVGVRTIKSDR